MQDRISPDRSRGMNLISLFAKLFFSGREYSLSDLASQLGCSKQTVLSLVGELEQQHWIIIDSELRQGRRYFSMRKSNLSKTRMALTDEEMEVPLMCRAFTGHLFKGEVAVTAELTLTDFEIELPRAEHEEFGLKLFDLAPPHESEE